MSRRIGLPALASTRGIGDKLCSLALVAVGVGVAVRGVHYGVIRSDGIVGPGFMPMLAGILLAAFSAGVLVKRIATDSRATVDTDAPHDEMALVTEAVETNDVAAAQAAATGGRAKEGSGRSLVIVFGSLLIGLIVARWLGLVLPLTLAIFSILYFAERKSLVRAMLTALIIGLLLYGIFDRLLQLPLPWGVFNNVMSRLG